MTRGALVFLVLALVFPLASSAQQSNSSMTDAQKLGRRVFQQRCAVCHTKPNINSKQYGPVLYKDLVDGNEDRVRDVINGGATGLMPGFRYGLEPAEIDAIIEYLKTVDRPARAPSKGGSGNM